MTQTICSDVLYSFFHGINIQNNMAAAVVFYLHTHVFEKAMHN